MDHENFTRIPNDVLEEAIGNKAMCARARVFMAILRKTYGWNKKEDWIALSQFEKMTGISKANICRTLRQLTALKIIIKSDNKYRINPIGKTWESLSNMTKKKPIIKSDKPLCQNGQSPLSDMTPTKDTLTKNTFLQKKDKTLQNSFAREPSNKMTKKHFDLFYRIFPKKGKKKTAERRFMKLDRSRFGLIMTAMCSKINTPTWNINRKQYAPYASYWIAGDMEEDIAALDLENPRYKTLFECYSDEKYHGIFE